MKNAIFLTSLLVLAVAGCEPNNDQNTPVKTDVKVGKVSDDPAKMALLPQMTETAKKQAGWASLSDAEKSPFLKYHDNDAAGAEKHYTTLAEMAANGEL
jgi:hypothetical protein